MFGATGAPQLGQYLVACVVIGVAVCGAADETGVIGEGGAAYGCAGTFIEKNAIVASIQATKIRSRPMKKTIVRIAPINNSKPAVSNMCSPDFCASALNARLKYIAAIK